MGVIFDCSAGQCVKYRLNYTDYDAGQHYGYAYFTLDCRGGKLGGLGCGDNVAEAICAPEGFNYRWYKLHDLNTLVSTDRCITPDANDTSQYVVYVVSETNFNCFFLLNAVLIPRWPKADATFTMRPESCENIVTFTNTSRVVTSNGTPVDGDIEAYYWDFGNGVESTEISPTVNYGSGGGSVTVRLVASMSDDQCTDTTYFNFTLPDLNQAKYEETVTICLGEVYRFNEKDYTETGVYVDTIPLKTGCDSILTLDLTVATIYEASDSLTICYGDTVQFGRFMLTETGFYSDTLPSKAGCDSVVNLYLSVSPVIDVMWDGMPLICEDDGTFNIRYNTLTEAKPTHYSLRFRGDAIRQGFLDVERASADEELTIVMPDGIRAGYYEASVELEDDVYNCGARAFDMKFTVHYSRNVIKQLWNDVLGLKNVNYNGGYDFISYQWFRDGDSIPGATTANYYVAGGELDFNAYYQARILRSDGVVLFTCPFTPVRLPDEINITPIVVVSMQFTVESPKKGRLELYNTSGIRVLTDELVEGESLLRAPALPGVYMVKMVFEDGSVKTSRLIVVSN